MRPRNHKFWRNIESTTIEGISRAFVAQLKSKSKRFKEMKA
jgi:hypothetical protein